MDTKDTKFDDKGDAVVEEVGKLKALTRDLECITKDEEEKQNSISDWITLIGRSVLSILKAGS